MQYSSFVTRLVESECEPRVVPFALPLLERVKQKELPPLGSDQFLECLTLPNMIIGLVRLQELRHSVVFQGAEALRGLGEREEAAASRH